MKKQRAFFRTILTLMLVFSMMAAPCMAQVEEMVDTKEKRDVVLYRGDIIALKVYSLTRIAISTPGIVDIVNADVDEILLVGKSLGSTQIFIWDEYGKRSVLARVMEQDLEMVKERIEQLLDAAEIEGVKLQHSAYEGKLIATGKVNKVQKEKFDEVVKDFDEFIINMVDEQGDLIQIDAQIIEVIDGWQKELGVKWDDIFSWGISENPTESRQINSPSDLFRIGSFSTTHTAITANFYAALVQTTKAKDISRPSIVVSDGEEASIVVGGEVPIETSETVDGVTSTDVEYKSYGVQLSVTPEIMDNDKIDVTLNISLSNQDSTFEGTGTAFTTTTTSTKVLLDDGQTLVIAGLLQEENEMAVEKVPFLHRVPILGKFLFTWQKQIKTPQKEVVILLTPRLRRQKNKLKTNQELEQEKEIQQLANEKSKEDFGVELDEDGLMVMRDKGQEQDDIMKTLGAHDAQAQEPDLDKVLADIEQSAGSMKRVMIDENLPLEISNYAKAVQQKIAARISFPLQAKEQGWQGQVVLLLTIFSDGTLGDVAVEQSSGYSIFDNDALNTAKIVAPFDPFSVEMEQDELTISIPVTYNQEAFLISDE